MAVEFMQFKHRLNDMITVASRQNTQKSIIIHFVCICSNNQALANANVHFFHSQFKHANFHIFHMKILSYSV